MATEIIFNEKIVKNPRIGELDYGTIITGAPGHPNSFYIKINKKRENAGICISCPHKHSLILNLKTGDIRAIPGDALVTVLEAKINVAIVPTHCLAQYMKNC